MSGASGELLLVSGLALGALHSLEPDHMAAMSTLVGRRRQRFRDALLAGAVWGLGHTLALAALGLVLLAADIASPEWLERALEAAVGVLLVGLGVARLVGVKRGLHLHPHQHGDEQHSHAHLHLGRVGRDSHRRHLHAPLWIGLLHGLAGTGAVLVVAPAVVVGSAVTYLLYVAAFGLGSVLSMGLFAGGVGRLIGSRRMPWLPAVSGLLSVAIGVLWLGRLAGIL